MFILSQNKTAMFNSDNFIDIRIEEIPQLHVYSETDIIRKYDYYVCGKHNENLSNIIGKYCSHEKASKTMQELFNSIVSNIPFEMPQE